MHPLIERLALSAVLIRFLPLRLQDQLEAVGEANQKVGPVLSVCASSTSFAMAIITASGKGAEFIVFRQSLRPPHHFRTSMTI